MKPKQLNLSNKLIALIAFLIIIGNQSFAQTNNTGIPSLKLSKLSDQQLLKTWQQTQQSGLSESEGINQLVRKGLDPADVNTYKKRLLQLQGMSRATNTGAKSFIKDSASFMQDSTWVNEVPKIKARSRYYGYEYFSNPTPLLQPDARVATPLNYVLGPGDELAVSITGIHIKDMNLRVSPEGNIQLEYLGFIALNGLTIEEATRKIKSKLSSIYAQLNNGKDQLSVTLSNIRSIRVTVIGEAEYPGDYVLNAQAGFFNVLYLSNGPTVNGSLRKIDLIRNNKVIDSVDFYEFLQKGIAKKNIRLQDQDIIRYRNYQKKLIVSGEVKHPAIYELIDQETLADGLNYAGGLQPTAIKDMVKIVQNDTRSLLVKDVAFNDYKLTIPRNGDSVFIDKILDIYTNRVVLEGAVFRPGNYELTAQLSVAQLIKRADGLRESAYANRAYIKRNRPGQEPALISFDLKKILAGIDPDILLNKEDILVIASDEELKNNLTVNIAGAVKNPGSYPYRRGMYLEDLILMANGFNNDAANHKVEISRLSKNRADTLANQLLDIFIVNVDTSLKNTNETQALEPLDYIFVPKLLNYRNLGTIKLGGEVLYAGEYALEKRNETVQEVIARAGGISPYASLADVQVFRNSLRVGTNILANVNGSDALLLLRAGDSIYVPRNEPFVEVKGAVFNPQILSYESGSFTSYISEAGGVTDKGNLKKAYVQYSSGINRKIRHFLFFRNYPRIYPGSKIIVPEKTESDRKGLSIIEVSALTGSLSALISLISILKK
jgi:protein involved in polysaccharide export with SLBB domain